MDFVITCLPGLGPLLADELTELGISVTDPGNAHVGIQGLQQDALRACLWSRLAERVLVPLAELDVTPDQAPERLAAAVDWRALVPPGVDLHLSLDHGKGVRGDSRVSGKRLLRALPPEIAAKVGSKSIVLVSAPLLPPAGILPGQRTTQGTRMPPSSVRPLRPRRGRLLPCFSRFEPLSEVKRTSVFSSMPSAFNALKISPMDQSISCTQSP